MRLKNRALFLVLLALAVAGLAVSARQAEASVSVSVSFFYDRLAPYGEWVTVSGYGPCWRPARVAADWQPYLDGEWAYTDYGWTWVSFDPWGGDPYHYGTWVFSGAYGWIWIPGTIWAPAWVTWCITDDFFGWAPVSPTFAVGVTGYLGPGVIVARRSYVFVPARQFVGVNVRSARVPIAENAVLVGRSRPMTRFTVQGGVLVSGGPALSRVEGVAGTRIQRVSLDHAKTQAIPLSTSPGGGRARIVVPASERARLIAAHAGHLPPPASRRAPEAVRSERAARPPSHAAKEAGPPVSRRVPEAAVPERAAPPRSHETKEARPPVRESAQRREEAPPQGRVERPPSAPPNAAKAPPPARENPPAKQKEAKEPAKEKEREKEK